MRYFKKALNIPVVILPVRGRVHDHDLLAGDEYAQYVPMYLYEVDANGNPLPAKAVLPPQSVPAPTRAIEVTHVSYPTRPPPPPELQKAWEARRPVLNKAPGFSMEDALARAAAETVPLPSESPPASAVVEAAPAVESLPVEKPATMEEQVAPKRKRGRPRKNPLPTA